MAEEGSVIEIHSPEEWTVKIDKANSSKKLVVIDFTASWCGPCRYMAPLLADLAKKNTNIIFLKVDVDEQKSIAEEFSVEAMPTFVFMRERKVKDKFVGASKDKLHEKVDKYNV